MSRMDVIRLAIQQANEGNTGTPQQRQHAEERLQQFQCLRQEFATREMQPAQHSCTSTSTQDSAFAQALAASTTVQNTPYVPDSFAAAMSSGDADRWLAAAEEEIHSLEHNNTWTLAPTPPGVRPLPT
eukprot:868858-Pelagomonas_calceolata.AAC.1